MVAYGAALSIKKLHSEAEYSTFDEVVSKLNAYNVEEAMKIVEGTARNMGIAIKGVNDAELAAQAQEALEHEKEMAKQQAALEKMEAEAEEMREKAAEESAEEAAPAENADEQPQEETKEENN